MYISVCVFFPGINLPAKQYHNDVISSGCVSSLTMGEISRYFGEILAAIVINGIVLVLLLRNSSTRKLTSNIFLINLIVADLVTGIMGLVACVSHYTRMTINVKNWTDSKMGFLFMYIFTSTLIVLLSATILVTLDRFMAIVKPYRYKEISTRRNVAKLLAIIWLFGAIILLLGLVFSTMDEPRTLLVAQRTLDYVVMVIAFAGILFLTIANSIILREVRKQIKLVSSISVFGDDEEAAKKSESSLRRKEIRAAHLCFSIVCVFICCWLPLSVGLAFSRYAKTNPAGKHLMDVGKALVFAGVILNPLLYVPFKTELRASLSRCFRSHKMRSKKANSIENQSSDRTEMHDYI